MWIVKASFIEVPVDLHFGSLAGNLLELSIHAFNLTSRMDCTKLIHKEMNSIVIVLRKGGTGVR